MKSTVCCKANEFVKKGYTKSAAFTKAWAIVKANAISGKLHDLSLSTDRYSRAQREEVSGLTIEHGRLISRANGIQTAAEIAEAEARKQKMIDDYNRREDIKFEISRIVYSSNPDWKRHKELMQELKAIA